MESTNFPNEKQAKNIGSMFKDIKGAAIAAGPLAGVFEGLSLLEPIFSAFEPVLEIVSGLFSAMSGAIMSEIIPALEPLMDALIDLMPVFIDLGVEIGKLIVSILVPLMDIFIDLFPVIDPIIGLLVDLFALGLIPLQVILEILSPIFELILPYIEDFSDLIEELSPLIQLAADAIEFLIKMALSPLAIAIFWVGEAIFAIIDAFTAGPIEARGAFREFFAELFTILDVELPGFLRSYLPPEPPPEGWSPPAGGTAPAPYQEGGFALTPHEAIVGEKPEVIIPLDVWYQSQVEMLFQQELTNDLLTRILADKEWRHR